MSWTSTDWSFSSLIKEQERRLKGDCSDYMRMRKFPTPEEKAQQDAANLVEQEKSSQ